MPVTPSVWGHALLAWLLQLWLRELGCRHILHPWVYENHQDPTALMSVAISMKATALSLGLVAVSIESAFLDKPHVWSEL